MKYGSDASIRLAYIKRRIRLKLASIKDCLDEKTYQAIEDALEGSFDFEELLEMNDLELFIEYLRFMVGQTQNINNNIKFDVIDDKLGVVYTEDELEIIKVLSRVPERGSVEIELAEDNEVDPEDLSEEELAEIAGDLGVHFVDDEEDQEDIDSEDLFSDDIADQVIIGDGEEEDELDLEDLDDEDLDDVFVEFESDDTDELDLEEDDEEGSDLGTYNSGELPVHAYTSEDTQYEVIDDEVIIVEDAEDDVDTLDIDDISEHDLDILFTDSDDDEDDLIDDDEDDTSVSEIYYESDDTQDDDDEDLEDALEDSAEITFVDDAEPEDDLDTDDTDDYGVEFVDDEDDYDLTENDEDNQTRDSSMSNKAQETDDKKQHNEAFFRHDKCNEAMDNITKFRNILKL